MKTYGQIKFSVVDAPQPMAGICEGFTYKRADQVYEHAGEGGEIAAVVMHGRKGDVSFSSSPEGGVTALGVRAGAELVITGVSGGKVIVTSSSARWSRGQAMVMEAQASHYPDLSATASGAVSPATIALSRTAGPLQLPTDAIWYGVEGLASPVPGIVQSCSVSESVQTQEEEDGEGAIVALAVYGYKATASMEVLTASALPELGSVLEVFAGFRVTSAEEKWQKGSTRSISLEGLLIPGVTE